VGLFPLTKRLASVAPLKMHPASYHVRALQIHEALWKLPKPAFLQMLHTLIQGSSTCMRQKILSADLQSKRWVEKCGRRKTISSSLLLCLLSSTYILVFYRLQTIPHPLVYLFPLRISPKMALFSRLSDHLSCRIAEELDPLGCFRFQLLSACVIAGLARIDS